MSSSQARSVPGDEKQARRRIGALVGAFLIGVALLSAMASTVAAKEPVGVYVNGKESAEESKQPKLEAESYPVVLSGTEDTAHAFGTKLGQWSCAVAEFDHGQSAATAVQVLWMSYYQCTPPLGVMKAINPNGCEYVLHVANAGPPYQGSLDMSCPAGKSYELVMASGVNTCTIAIPSQTGLKGVNLTNVGSGSARGVQVAFEVTGMSYSLLGPKLLCQAGSYTNGTYTGTMTLRGSDE
ncbi:MAG TPA: hypothetical protein VEW07_09870 [Solirubrobacterales bacterium]|nr:hypothetical protein [Solirubrobacterales bacterium]